MGLKNIKANLLSSVFQELIRTPLLGIMPTFRFPSKRWTGVSGMSMGMFKYPDCSAHTVCSKQCTVSVGLLCSEQSTASIKKKNREYLSLSVLQLWSFWHGECKTIPISLNCRLVCRVSVIMAHLWDWYISTLFEKLYFGAWLVVWRACYSGRGIMMEAFRFTHMETHRIRLQFSSAFKDITCG